MFGIGLPEMLLIMALALIVVGPDKLPDLARSLAKGLMELKKTAESLKGSFSDKDNPLNEIRPELEEAAKSLTSDLLDPSPHNTPDILNQVIQPADRAAEAYQELLKHTSGPPPGVQTDTAARTDASADTPADVVQTPPQNPTEAGTEPIAPNKNEP